jgi:hypothetical protein
MLGNKFETNDINSKDEKVNQFDFKDIMKITNRNFAKFKQNEQLLLLDKIENTNDNQFALRSNVCSAKKLPGNTPVKDLEPTLKMVIIRELSIEKLDGLNFPWKFFQKIFF